MTACLKIQTFKRAAHVIQQHGICLKGKKPQVSIFCTTKTNILPTILFPPSTATKYLAQLAKAWLKNQAETEGGGRESGRREACKNKQREKKQTKIIS